MAIYKRITGIINVRGEMAQDKGEDCSGFVVEEKNCCLAVFDGCGGIGSQIYGGDFRHKTGAYWAAKLARTALFSWYRKSFLTGDCSVSFESVPSTCFEIKQQLKDRLLLAEATAKAYQQEDLLKGSMKRSFPTTACVFLCNADNDFAEMNFIWAGDSRGYLLTSNGLLQITEDDTERNLDAWDSMENDQPLSNFISADMDFKLNACHLSSEWPFLAIVATDGAYNYFPSPIHFEYALLQTLDRSETFREWKDLLDGEIRGIASDDYSIVLAAVGYQGFSHLKESFRERLNFLTNQYIEPIEQADPGESRPLAKRLWSESYKDNYYREEP